MWHASDVSGACDWSVLRIQPCTHMGGVSTLQRQAHLSYNTMFTHLQSVISNVILTLYIWETETDSETKQNHE